ncbi:MAG TPA: hypothetical protein VHV09_22405 [Trebonia sp.]|nr:hypothetical protein [Trebonia sp.]
MRFSVDGWDPSYGASVELEGQLEESTATINADVEVPAGRWRPVDPDAAGPWPDALLFVDGVRRIEARAWVDGDPQPDGLPPEATAALCASFAAGVVCCCAAGAHVVAAELRRGLFSVASHANDIVTRAGRYRAYHVTPRRADVPVMAALSGVLQDKLSDVEKIAAAEARSPGGGGRLPSGHAAGSETDLLVVDGPLRGRENLPRVLGYIKSHHKTYLPPELNALVGALAPGQRTPAFHMGTSRTGTSWERHSWYLRLPSPGSSPWAGVVRIECASALTIDEVTRLAGLSQRCLGRFASEAYKDSRAPQNLYPIAGLERELRRRLGDPKVLYRALREAARAGVAAPAASRPAGPPDSGPAGSPAGAGRGPGSASARQGNRPRPADVQVGAVQQ